MFRWEFEIAGCNHLIFVAARRADKIGNCRRKVGACRVWPQLKSGKTSAGRFGKISRRMKPIRWSAHARKKADKREISKADVEQTLMQWNSTCGSKRPAQFFSRLNWTKFS